MKLHYCEVVFTENAHLSEIMLSLKNQDNIYGSVATLIACKYQVISNSFLSSDWSSRKANVGLYNVHSYICSFCSLEISTFIILAFIDLARSPQSKLCCSSVVALS